LRHDYASALSFRRAGVPLVLILLFAYGPMLVLLIGGLVASAHGCSLPIDGSAGPCVFMGVDLATFLAFAVVCGCLSFFTYPTVNFKRDHPTWKGASTPQKKNILRTKNK
jgi:hypothetical protein